MKIGDLLDLVTSGAAAVGKAVAPSKKPNKNGTVRRGKSQVQWKTAEEIEREEKQLKAAMARLEAEKRRKAEYEKAQKQKADKLRAEKAKARAEAEKARARAEAESKSEKAVVNNALPVEDKTDISKIAALVAEMSEAPFAVEPSAENITVSEAEQEAEVTENIGEADIVQKTESSDAAVADAATESAEKAVQRKAKKHRHRVIYAPVDYTFTEEVAVEEEDSETFEEILTDYEEEVTLEVDESSVYSTEEFTEDEEYAHDVLPEPVQTEKAEEITEVGGIPFVAPLNVSFEAPAPISDDDNITMEEISVPIDEDELEASAIPEVVEVIEEVKAVTVTEESLAFDEFDEAIKQPVAETKEITAEEPPENDVVENIIEELNFDVIDEVEETKVNEIVHGVTEISQVLEEKSEVEEAAETFEEAPAVEESAEAIEETPEVEEVTETTEEAPTVEEAAEAIEEVPEVEEVTEAPAVEEAAETFEEVPAVEEAAETFEEVPTVEEAAEAFEEVPEVEEVAETIEEAPLVESITGIIGSETLFEEVPVVTSDNSSDEFVVDYVKSAEASEEIVEDVPIADTVAASDEITVDDFFALDNTEEKNTAEESNAIAEDETVADFFTLDGTDDTQAEAVEEAPAVEEAAEVIEKVPAPVNTVPIADISIPDITVAASDEITVDDFFSPNDNADIEAVADAEEIAVIHEDETVADFFALDGTDDTQAEAVEEAPTVEEAAEVIEKVPAPVNTVPIMDISIPDIDDGSDVSAKSSNALMREAMINADFGDLLTDIEVSPANSGIRTMDFFDMPEELEDSPTDDDVSSIEDLFGDLLIENEKPAPEPVITKSTEVFAMFDAEKPEEDDFDQHNDSKIEEEVEKKKTLDLRRQIAQDIADNIATFAPILESLNAIRENKVRAKSGIIFDWEMRIQALIGDPPIKTYWRNNFANYEIWPDEKYMEKAGELIAMLELVGIVRDTAKEVVFNNETLQFYSAQSEQLNNDFKIGETTVVVRPCWKINGKPARKGEISKKAPFAEFSHKQVSPLEQMLRLNKCDDGDVNIPVTDEDFCTFDRDIPYIKHAIESGVCKCAVRRMEGGSALAFFYEVIGEGESSHYDPCTLRFEITIDKNCKLIGRFRAEKV